MCRLPLFFLAGILLSCKLLQAQSYSVHVHRLDGPDSSLNRLLEAPHPFSLQNAAYSYTRAIIPQLQEGGYLAASADSIAVLPTGYEVYVYLGEQWRWARLSLAGIAPPLLAASGITESQFANRPLHPAQLSRLSERILHWCEDNGYPFARLGLDSVEISTKPGEINARIHVDTGPIRHIDSIIIDGDVHISKAFLMRYLDLYEGGVYNESHILSITRKLHDLSFLQENSSWSIRFRLLDTKLHLNLKERKSNQLNLILGLQPNTVATGKFLFTADAQAAFQNLIGNGESFSFSYQKLQAASPRIKAEAVYPYLLGTPIGADGHFDLYFNGTQYRRTSFDLGGRYALNAQDFIRLYYKGSNNRVINPDTAFIITYHKLPDNIDLNTGGAGIEFQSSRLDYKYNPSKGWSARVSGEALSRKVRKNDGITGIQDGSGFDFTTLYDSLSIQSYQYHVNADLAYYLPLRKRVVLKSAYSGGWISGERLFQNELYQLGGFHMLRGFDEGSIFANQYHILTAELRLLFSRNSNVYLFSDNAWLQSNINGFSNEGFYNGFGLGTVLETKAGQFTIAYGLGRSTGNPLQLRQSKIHINYVAFF